MSFDFRWPFFKNDFLKAALILQDEDDDEAPYSTFSCVKLFSASGEAILGTQRYFIKALYTSTLSKHFTRALYPSTLNKHFIQALYTSTLSKHFTQALYQSTLSKHFIKGISKAF